MPGSGQERRYCLLVDGGGTKTACRILEISGGEEMVVGSGKATGSNPAALGVKSAAAAVRAAVDQAMQSAGLQSASRIDRAALAIAGTLDNTLRTQLEQCLGETPLARECRVFPDVLPIVMAAAAEGPAAAVIAGTGSVAIIRTAEGKYALAGGWGYLLGDEGSGYAIGRDAVRVTLEQLESGGPLCLLPRMVLGDLKATTIADVKRLVYQGDQPRRLIAGLAPLVLAACQQDSVAQQIVQSAARQLVAVLQRALMRYDLPSAEVPIAAAGGVFSAGTPVRSIFEQALGSARLAPRVHYVDDSLSACTLLLEDSLYNAPIDVLP